MTVIKNWSYTYTRTGPARSYCYSLSVLQVFLIVTQHQPTDERPRPPEKLKPAPLASEPLPAFSYCPARFFPTRPACASLLPAWEKQQVESVLRGGQLSQTHIASAGTLIHNARSCLSSTSVTNENSSPALFVSSPSRPPSLPPPVQTDEEMYSHLRSSALN